MRNRTILFTLKTLAKTRYVNNFEDVKKEKKVHIIWDGDYNINGFIFNIENTPGSWYLTTLLESPSKYLENENSFIYIHGLEFTCTNISFLLKEALEELKRRKIQLIID